MKNLNQLAQQDVHNSEVQQLVQTADQTRSAASSAAQTIATQASLATKFNQQAAQTADPAQKQRYQRSTAAAAQARTEAHNQVTHLENQFSSAAERISSLVASDRVAATVQASYATSDIATTQSLVAQTDQTAASLSSAVQTAASQAAADLQAANVQSLVADNQTYLDQVAALQTQAAQLDQQMDSLAHQGSVAASEYNQSAALETASTANQAHLQASQGVTAALSLANQLNGNFNLLQQYLRNDQAGAQQKAQQVAQNAARIQSLAAAVTKTAATTAQLTADLQALTPIDQKNRRIQQLQENAHTIQTQTQEYVSLVQQAVQTASQADEQAQSGAQVNNLKTVNSLAQTTAQQIKDLQGWSVQVNTLQSSAAAAQSQAQEVIHSDHSRGQQQAQSAQAQGDATADSVAQLQGEVAALRSAASSAASLAQTDWQSAKIQSLANDLKTALVKVNQIARSAADIARATDQWQQRAQSAAQHNDLNAAQQHATSVADLSLQTNRLTSSTTSLTSEAHYTMLQIERVQSADKDAAAQHLAVLQEDAGHLQEIAASLAAQADAAVTVNDQMSSLALTDVKNKTVQSVADRADAATTQVTDLQRRVADTVSETQRALTAASSAAHDNHATRVKDLAAQVSAAVSQARSAAQMADTTQQKLQEQQSSLASLVAHDSETAAQQAQNVQAARTQISAHEQRYTAALSEASALTTTLHSLSTTDLENDQVQNAQQVGIQQVAKLYEGQTLLKNMRQQLENIVNQAQMAAQANDLEQAHQATHQAAEYRQQADAIMKQGNQTLATIQSQVDQTTEWIEQDRQQGAETVTAATQAYQRTHAAAQTLQQLQTSFNELLKEATSQAQQDQNNRTVQRNSHQLTTLQKQLMQANVAVQQQLAMAGQAQNQTSSAASVLAVQLSQQFLSNASNAATAAESNASQAQAYHQSAAQLAQGISAAVSADHSETNQAVSTAAEQIATMQSHHQVLTKTSDQLTALIADVRSTAQVDPTNAAVQHLAQQTDQQEKALADTHHAASSAAQILQHQYGRLQKAAGRFDTNDTVSYAKAMDQTAGNHKQFHDNMQTLQQQLHQATSKMQTLIDQDRQATKKYLETAQQTQTAMTPTFQALQQAAAAAQPLRSETVQQAQLNLTNSQVQSAATQAATLNDQIDSLVENGSRTLADANQIASEAQATSATDVQTMSQHAQSLAAAQQQLTQTGQQAAYLQDSLAALRTKVVKAVAADHEAAAHAMSAAAQVLATQMTLHQSQTSQALATLSETAAHTQQMAQENPTDLPIKNIVAQLAKLQTDADSLAQKMTQTMTAGQTTLSAASSAAAANEVQTTQQASGQIQQLNQRTSQIDTTVRQFVHQADALDQSAANESTAVSQTVQKAVSDAATATHQVEVAAGRADELQDSLAAQHQQIDSLAMADQTSRLIQGFQKQIQQQHKRAATLQDQIQQGLQAAQQWQQDAQSAAEKHDVAAASSAVYQTQRAQQQASAVQSEMDSLASAAQNFVQQGEHVRLQDHQTTQQQVGQTQRALSQAADLAVKMKTATGQLGTTISSAQALAQQISTDSAAQEQVVSIAAHSEAMAELNQQVASAQSVLQQNVDQASSAAVLNDTAQTGQVASEAIQTVESTRDLHSTAESLVSAANSQTAKLAITVAHTTAATSVAQSLADNAFAGASEQQQNLTSAYQQLSETAASGMRTAALDPQNAAHPSVTELGQQIAQQLQLAATTSEQDQKQRPQFASLAAELQSYAALNNAHQADRTARTTVSLAAQTKNLQAQMKQAHEQIATFSEKVDQLVKTDQLAVASLAVIAASAAGRTTDSAQAINSFAQQGQAADADTTSYAQLDLENNDVQSAQKMVAHLAANVQSTAAQATSYASQAQSLSEAAAETTRQNDVRQTQQHVQNLGVLSQALTSMAAQTDQQMQNVIQLHAKAILQVQRDQSAASVATSTAASEVAVAQAASQSLAQVLAYVKTLLQQAQDVSQKVPADHSAWQLIDRIKETQQTLEKLVQQANGFETQAQSASSQTADYAQRNDAVHANQQMARTHQATSLATANIGQANELQHTADAALEQLTSLVAQDQHNATSYARAAQSFATNTQSTAQQVAAGQSAIQALMPQAATYPAKDNEDAADLFQELTEVSTATESAAAAASEWDSKARSAARQADQVAQQNDPVQTYVYTQQTSQANYQTNKARNTVSDLVSEAESVMRQLQDLYRIDSNANENAAQTAKNVVQTTTAQQNQVQSDLATLQDDLTILNRNQTADSENADIARLAEQGQHLQKLAEQVAGAVEQTQTELAQSLAVRSQADVTVASASALQSSRAMTHTQQEQQHRMEHLRELHQQAQHLIQRQRTLMGNDQRTIYSAAQFVTSTAADYEEDASDIHSQTEVARSAAATGKQLADSAVAQQPDRVFASLASDQAAVLSEASSATATVQNARQVASSATAALAGMQTAYTVQAARKAATAVQTAYAPLNLLSDAADSMADRATKLAAQTQARLDSQASEAAK
ncbi:hypothetical protein [Lactobacillus selangorensis]|nr:hypothetical protein [Lactobacillus selangorensis]